MQYDVSICIPTYNRDKFLDELIASINDNLIDIDNFNIEIVISDNCSIDNTNNIVAKWKQIIPCKITYIVNDKNLGPDLNYLKAVNMANGKYCWLVGSDDLLKPNAIKELFQILFSNNGVDIFLFNRTACDLNMNIIEETKWLNVKNACKEFDLTISEHFIDYCNRAKYLGAFFSYLSSIIIKKEIWDKVSFDNAFNNTGYSHVYYILTMITRFNSKLLFLNKSLILFRSGNDYFSKDGFYRRVMLDFRGYIQLSKLIQINNRRLFLSVLKKEHGYLRVLKLFSQNLSEQEHEELYCILKEIGYNPCLLNVINMIANKKLVFFLLKIKKMLGIYRL
ncbi:glycosyltransferase family 2 protein [Campylobacter sp. MOP7]|uniref:glycosyltransferase family 2 protein n=1 Tax=Campylobacter canis TaxID=3378588 RepID=UPI00387E3260